MMQYFYLFAFIVSATMAGSARYDKNYSEMRPLLMVSLVFYCLWFEKFLVQVGWLVQ